MSQKILKNSVKCNKCNDIINSYSEVNTTSCKCGNVKISGGFIHLIREGTDFEELSQYYLTED